MQAFELVVNSVAAMAVPEMVEEAIAQGVSTVLLGGVFKGVGTVTKLTAMQAARATQPLVKIAKATEAYQKIATTAESIQTSLARSRVRYLGEKAEAVIADMELKVPTSSLMEAEQTAGGGSKVMSAAEKEAAKLAKVIKAQKITEYIAKYTEACKKLGLRGLSKSFCDHVFESHMPGGAKLATSIKSVFNKDIDFVKLAIEGWERGSKVDVGIKTYDFGYIIGVNKHGIPTSTVQIVLNETLDGFRTIYPI